MTSGSTESADTPQPRLRLPGWLRMPLPTNDTYGGTRRMLATLRLHTVCESAKCPNHWECWSKGTATFMIAGDRCTRACGFCAISTAKPLPLDPEEPARVAEAVRRMKLRHAVITSVARDDLADGGAMHFKQTIEAVHQAIPGVAVEVLVPDFNDRDASIDLVLSARPEVFNHNLETVRRLSPSVRSRATYDRSLSVLHKARQRGAPSLHTKSGLMLGLGECRDEVIQAMRDLRAVGCAVLTLGQYLQPSRDNLPVREYIRPEQFSEYDTVAREMGFFHVASGPTVRSSYHAADIALAAVSSVTSADCASSGEGPRQSQS